MYPTFEFPHIKAGNTLQPPVMQYVSVDANEATTPISLVGYTIKARLLAPGSKKLVHQWATDQEAPNVQTQDAATGYFQLFPWNAEVPVGTYIGDIDFISPDGVKDTFCNLKLTVVDAY